MFGYFRFLITSCTNYFLPFKVILTNDFALTPTKSKKGWYIYSINEINIPPGTQQIIETGVKIISSCPYEIHETDVLGSLNVKVVWFNYIEEIKLIVINDTGHDLVLHKSFKIAELTLKKNNSTY